MMKIRLLLIFALIGVLYAMSPSCKSCGKECEQACGTRRFRTCCFNYLRKKRGPDTEEFWAPIEEVQRKQGKVNVVFLEFRPEDVFGKGVRVPMKYMTEYPIGNVEELENKSL